MVTFRSKIMEDMNMIDGNWNPPHRTHRIGRSVDVSKTTVEGNTVNKNILMDFLRKDEINGSLFDEDERHYHISF